MKNSRKAIPFISISLLCGITVVWFYRPFYLYTTRLWFFEFPLFSLSMLIRMTCVLFAGVFLGIIARKYAAHAQSKFQSRTATSGIFFNAILLVLPVLNLISMFTPRTITGVVDYKIESRERGYICMTQIGTGSSWSQEVNIDDNTVIYEQDQKVDQQKGTTNTNAIQPGQVVEIGYIDNGTSIFGIKASSITILKQPHRPYKGENCGNLLP